MLVLVVNLGHQLELVYFCCYVPSCCLLLLLVCRVWSLSQTTLKNNLEGHKAKGIKSRVFD